MIKMEQEEFDKLLFDTLPKNCNHPEVVRLYTMGVHADYGCLKCGLEHTNKEVFDKIRLFGYSCM